MKIVLFTKEKFLINEISKIDENINIISSFEDLFDFDTINLLLFHLDSSAHFMQDLKILNENFSNLKIVLLRNNPSNNEGASLLKKGAKAYVHSLANFKVINQAIQEVKKGNIWVYPELMQYLINIASLDESSEKELLNKLTVKELETLKLVSKGLTNKQISLVLKIAEVTVKKHIGVLFKKLDKKDRLSLALFYKNNI